MMTPLDHQTVARELLDSYQTRQPIDPLVDRVSEMTVDDAYRIQLAQARDRAARGEILVGYKVGLTSAPMRTALGVDVPDYGHLFDTMLWPEGERIPLDRFIAPKVEPEVAFVLEHDLTGPGVTAATAARAVAYCLTAIEIIDSRIRDWRITLRDTIADNGSSGGVVLGERPIRVTDLDLRMLGCVFVRNRTVCETGAGAAVLGGPLKSLAWLANTLSEHGPLPAGSIIMSGSITASLSVADGDTFDAELDRLGRVSAQFSGGGNE
jgi:2-keto-4-pentenoate hydratase